MANKKRSKKIQKTSTMNLVDNSDIDEDHPISSRIHSARRKSKKRQKEELRQKQQMNSKQLEELAKA